VGEAALDLDEVAAWLRDARQIVVLTGAGISTESGIPDFRGPQGLWTKNPGAEKTATLEHYVGDPEVRAQAWRNRLTSGMWDAEPNAAHRALAELERRAALHTIVTQNVDGLHHAAGSSPERIIEIHGNVREAKCLSCDWRGPMGETLDRVRAGETDPRCHTCGGILKSATISFGQSLVEDDLERSFAAAAGCDCLLAVGTSLAVFPIARMVPVAVSAGARVVIVNGEPTGMDELAEVVVRRAISEVLGTICGVAE